MLSGPCERNETVAEMAQRGTWYVPTFAIYRWHAERGTALRQARARELIAPHRESFARARAAGVRVALGTDSGAYGHGAVHGHGHGHDHAGGHHHDHS